MPIKKSLLILLTSMVVLAQLSTDIYLPAVKTIGLDFHASDHIVQFSITAYFIGFAVCMLLSGLLADRFGRKNTILSFLVLYGFATIICIFSHSINELLLGRFLQGLGGGAGTVIARVIVRDLFEEKEAVHALVFISAGIQCSPLIAPLIGGSINVAIGWRSIFIFLLVINLLLITATYFFLKDAHQPEHFSFKKLFSQWGLCLRNTDFVISTAIISFFYGGYFVFISCSPFIFMRTFNFSSMHYALYYTFIIVSYILGAILARKLIRIYPSDKIIQRAILLAGIAVILFFFGLHLVSFTMGIFIYLIATGLIMPVCQAKALMNIHTSRGMAASLLYGIEFGFASLLGLILSATSSISMTVTFPALIFFCFILASVSFLTISAIKNRKVL